MEDKYLERQFKRNQYISEVMMKADLLEIKFLFALSRKVKSKR